MQISTAITTQDRVRGCLLGLAVGDAVGTTVEFKQRGSFEPVTDMIGGGPFNLALGQWTDDTSMALCLAESLAVLKAVNLGDDTDTTAAVCGQIAGAYYGASGIPATWLDNLHMRPEITTLADKCHNHPLSDHISESA